MIKSIHATGVGCIITGRLVCKRHKRKGVGIHERRGKSEILQGSRSGIGNFDVLIPRDWPKQGIRSQHRRIGSNEARGTTTGIVKWRSRYGERAYLAGITGSTTAGSRDVALQVASGSEVDAPVTIWGNVSLKLQISSSSGFWEVLLRRPGVSYCLNPTAS